MKRIICVGAVAIAAFGLAGCGGDSAPSRVTAKSVAEKCDAHSTRLKVGDDEKSIEYLFKPGTQDEEDMYKCLLRETKAPSSVDSRVQETRPVDGMQTANWDGWEMHWRYKGGNDGAMIILAEK